MRQSEGLVDELMPKLNPVAIGSGIPLFSGGARKVNLDLKDSKMFAGSVSLLRYGVQS